MEKPENSLLISAHPMNLPSTVKKDPSLLPSVSRYRTTQNSQWPKIQTPAEQAAAIAAKSASVGRNRTEGYVGQPPPPHTYDIAESIKEAQRVRAAVSNTHSSEASSSSSSASPSTPTPASTEPPNPSPHSSSPVASQASSSEAPPVPERKIAPLRTYARASKATLSQPISQPSQPSQLSSPVTLVPPPIIPWDGLPETGSGSPHLALPGQSTRVINTPRVVSDITTSSMLPPPVPKGKAPMRPYNLNLSSMSSITPATHGLNTISPPSASLSAYVRASAPASKPMAPPLNTAARHVPWSATAPRRPSPLSQSFTPDSPPSASQPLGDPSGSNDVANPYQLSSGSNNQPQFTPPTPPNSYSTTTASATATTYPTPAIYPASTGYQPAFMTSSISPAGPSSSSFSNGIVLRPLVPEGGYTSYSSLAGALTPVTRPEGYKPYSSLAGALTPITRPTTSNDVSSVPIRAPQPVAEVKSSPASPITATAKDPQSTLAPSGRAQLTSSEYITAQPSSPVVTPPQTATVPSERIEKPAIALPAVAQPIVLPTVTQPTTPSTVAQPITLPTVAQPITLPTIARLPVTPPQPVTTPLLSNKANAQPTSAIAVSWSVPQRKDPVQITSPTPASNAPSDIDVVMENIERTGNTLCSYQPIALPVLELTASTSANTLDTSPDPEFKMDTAADFTPVKEVSTWFPIVQRPLQTPLPIPVYSPDTVMAHTSVPLSGFHSGVQSEPFPALQPTNTKGLSIIDRLGPAPSQNLSLLGRLGPAPAQNSSFLDGLVLPPLQTSQPVQKLSENLPHISSLLGSLPSAPPRNHALHEARGLPVPQEAFKLRPASFGLPQAATPNLLPGLGLPPNLAPAGGSDVPNSKSHSENPLPPTTSKTAPTAISDRPLSSLPVSGLVRAKDSSIKPGPAAQGNEFYKMLQELPSVAPLYNPIPIKYVLSPTALPEEVRRKGREIQRLSFRRSTKMEKAKTRPSELPERSTGKGKGKMRLSEPPERSPSEKVKKRTGAPVKARKTKKHVRFVEEESSSDESASTVDDLSLNDLLDDDADASPGVWKHQKDNSSGPGFFDVFPILFILPLLILRNL